MTDQAGPTIGLRCFCGKHYRVRNAKAGYRTTCPDCGSLLEVTAADLETAFGADGSIELHEDQVEPKAAVPISTDELRPASKGARPGVTEGISYAHDEARLYSAMGGRPLEASSPAGLAAVEVTFGRRRSFVADMVASFYLVGSLNNVKNLGITSGATSLLVIAWWVLPFPFVLFALVPMFLALLYIMYYYWNVLKTTAGGEDEVPWFQTDWNFWDDAIKPFCWISLISWLCSLPANCVEWFVSPALPYHDLIAFAALTVGWLFWPVAVMSVALGNTILFIRPDWLVRCIIGIGPVYLLAWLLVMITLFAWRLAWRVPPPTTQIAAVDALIGVVYAFLLVAMNFYFGYVLFRMLGLIFRHFRTRFPWKY